jgi:hypothetical protein
MLSRLRLSHIAPIALKGILPCSERGRLLSLSHTISKIHQPPYLIGAHRFSTTRPRSRKDSKGEEFDKLISAIGKASRAKSVKELDDVMKDIGAGDMVPLLRRYGPFIGLLQLIGLVWIVWKCVQWALRFIGVLETPLSVDKPKRNEGKTERNENGRKGD